MIDEYVDELTVMETTTIDYTNHLEELNNNIMLMNENINTVNSLLYTLVALYIFDFIWKKIKQPKSLRSGING